MDGRERGREREREREKVLEGGGGDLIYIEEERQAIIKQYYTDVVCSNWEFDNVCRNRMLSFVLYIFTWELTQF